MEFSFEYQAERIYDSKNKEYFREVISSYNNGNYRSEVVMLYSVVICDLVYKLTELKDLYNDEIAIDILKAIDEKQKQNPTSSEWENDLVEYVFKRTELINNAENEAIQYLKKHRHLSAHPVINEHYVLFEPNKENVRSHMRNMLEGVLLKTPLLSKKIAGKLLENLADLNSQALHMDELKRFLNNRYFKKYE